MPYTTAENQTLVLSKELNEVLTQHIKDTFLTDEWNRNQLTTKGFLTPHTELLQEELEEQGNTALLRELSTLPDEFRYSN